MISMYNYNCACIVNWCKKLKGGNYKNMEFLALGIALLFTVVVYLIFPIIYVKKFGKVSESQAKKLAGWNSTICCLIFLVVGICIGLSPATNGTMLAPAVFYYSIAKSILIDKSLPYESQIENKNSDNKICPKCGKEISNDNNKCSSCGFALENTENNKIKVESLNEINKKAENSSSTYINPETTKTSSLLQNSIIKMQKITAIIFLLLIIFCVLYPIIACLIRNSIIPSQTEYKTNRLTRLDSNQTIYCNSDGNYNYVYIKQDGQIVLYRFQNYSMYDSNGERVGYATTQQIKNQFADVKIGTPSVYFVTPLTFFFGLSFGVILFGTFIVSCVIVYKKAKEDLFKLDKTDKFLIDLKNQLKNEDISVTTYKKKRKSYYSEYILNNNKFFSIFKILY